MNLLESKVQAKGERADASSICDQTYVTPLAEEVRKRDTYLNGTKFALQKVRTYSCEAKME